MEIEEEAEQRAAGERLPQEPPAEADAAQVITLRLRLPATAEAPAKMVIRRFFWHNCCLNVFDYAHSLGFPISKFKLITTFPRMDVSAPRPWGGGFFVVEESSDVIIQSADSHFQRKRNRLHEQAGGRI